MMKNEIRLFVTTMSNTSYNTTKKIFESYDRSFIRWSNDKENSKSVCYRVKTKNVEKIIKKLNKKLSGNYTVTYDRKENVVKFMI